MKLNDITIMENRNVHEKMTPLAIGSFSNKISRSWLMFRQVSHKISFLPLVRFLVGLGVVLLVLDSGETKLTKMHSFHKVYHAIFNK